MDMQAVLRYWETIEEKLPFEIRIVNSHNPLVPAVQEDVAMLEAQAGKRFVRPTDSIGVSQPEAQDTPAADQAVVWEGTLFPRDVLRYL
jgi:hypothetical protein